MKEKQVGLFAESKVTRAKQEAMVQMPQQIHEEMNKID